MKKYVWTSIAVALLLPVLAAQPQRGYPPRDGRTANISRVVADCEERTTVQGFVAAALDRSALNGTRREDQLTWTPSVWNAR